MTIENRSTSIGAVLVTFLVGVVAGILGGAIVPGLIRPYLPESLAGADELVYGVVTGKRLEADRLLVTLPTTGGTVLATFTNDIAEIDLMVGVGDSITFGMDEYKPFVTNPTIARVVTLSSPLDSSRIPPPTRDSMIADTTARPEVPMPDPRDTTSLPDSSPAGAGR
jgi:hypothetical protein